MLDVRRSPAFALFFVLLTAVGAVRADDRETCRYSVGETRVKACTRVLAMSATVGTERTDALVSRASALQNLVNWAAAAADLNEAMRLDPDSAATFWYRSLQALLERDTKLAMQHVDEAIRRDPNNSRAYNTRGNMHRTAGHLDKAMEDLDAAIRIDPKNVQAYLNRATINGGKGAHDLVIRDYQEVLKVLPGSPQALNGIGLVLTRKGEREAAKDYYDRAVKADPGYASAYYNRGVYWFTNENWDFAIADFDVALSIEPHHAYAMNDRGYCYARKGDRDRALADFNAALEANPDLIVALNNRALAYVNRGEKAKAAADYSRVLAIKATNTPDRQRQETAKERLARLQKELGGTALPVSSGHRHKRVALVIGNGKYTQVGALANPANDAKAVAQSLGRLGFTSITEVVDATREQMQSALKEFGDAAEGAEWAVVFFAGHGIEINGVTYMIPVDAALKRDTHAEDEAIALARVMAKVDAASKIGLVILDSCRDNPFLKRMVRSAGATRSLGAGLAQVEPEGNVLVAYAAKHGTTAEDGAGRHSPFTESLLRHLEQPDLEVTFLFRKVRDDVRRKTQRRQEPYHYGSLGGEPLYFKRVSAR